MTLTVAPTLALKLYNIAKTISGEVATPITSNIWFPTPPDLVALPATPTYTINAELLPANSVVAPDWFDPENVDLEQLFNDLLPVDSPATYPVELEASKLVEAQDEIVPVDLVIRSLFSAFYATYSVTPQLSAVNLSLKTIVQTLRWITAEACAVVCTGHGAVLSKTYDPISRPGAFTASGQPAIFKLQPLKLKGDAYLFKVEDAKTITRIGGEATILDALEQTDSIVVGTTISIDYYTYKFGVSSVRANQNSIIGLISKPNKAGIKAYQDFSVSFWLNPQQDISQNSVAGIIQLSERFGVCLYRPPLSSETFIAYGEFSSTGYITSGDKYFTPLIVHGQTITLDTFFHIAVESYAQQMRLYINGVQALVTQTNPGIVLDETNIFTLFGVGIFSNDVLSIDTDIATIRAYLDDLVIDNFGRYSGQNFSTPSQPLATIEATQLVKRRVLAGASASFSLSGQSVNINTLDFSLKADVGIISLIGQISNLNKFNIKMPADAGAFTSTGFIANEGPYFVSGSNTSSAYTGGVTPGFVVRTFTPPANYQVNDIMVFMAETSGDTTVFPTMTGWNLIGSAPIVDLATSDGSKFYVWWRRVSSLREPSWSLPVEDHITASVFLIRNADPDASPIATFASTSTTIASTSFVAPTVALNTPLTRVFVLAANPVDSSSTTRYSALVNTSLTDLTEHYEYASTNNNGGGLVVVSGKRLKSGVVNATTMTKSFSSTDTILTVAFKSKGVESIVIARSITAAAGSYIISGQNAAVNRVTLFTASAGSYIVSGLNADLRLQQSLYAGTGSFTQLGQLASLIATRILTAAADNFALTGQNAEFKVAVIMNSDAGSYTVSGSAVVLRFNYVLTSNTANYSISGQDATLTYTPAIGSLEDQFELTTLLEDDLLTLDF